MDVQTLMVVAVAHSTPSIQEQVELYKAQRIALGTKIRGRDRSNIDARARFDLDLLGTIAARGGLAVIRFAIGNERRLGLVEGGQLAEVTPNGLHSIRVARWVKLPDSITHINSKGNAICAITGTEAEHVRLAAAEAGLLP